MSFSTFVDAAELAVGLTLLEESPVADLGDTTVVALATLVDGDDVRTLRRHVAMATVVVVVVVVVGVVPFGAVVESTARLRKMRSLRRLYHSSV